MDEATQTIRALRSRLCLSHGMRGQGQNPDQRALFMGVRGRKLEARILETRLSRGDPFPSQIRSLSLISSGFPEHDPPFRVDFVERLGVLLGLETGHTDVHSGVTGGTTRNPLAEYVWSLLPARTRIAVA